VVALADGYAKGVDGMAGRGCGAGGVWGASGTKVFKDTSEKRGCYRGEQHAGMESGSGSDQEETAVVLGYCNIEGGAGVTVGGKGGLITTGRDKLEEKNV